MITRTFFWEKSVFFNKKKIYLLILMSIIKKNLRVMLGKRNDSSLKKHKKYKTLNLTQKLTFLWKIDRIFLKVPPSSIYHFD